MSERLRIIKKGEWVIISAGEYSDYQTFAIGRAKVDIDARALSEEYLGLNPKQRKQYGFNESQFVKWLLVDKAVIKEINYVEWWLGAYSTLDFDMWDSDE